VQAGAHKLVATGDLLLAAIEERLLEQEGNA
jgi:hypothetical protein